MTRSQNTRTSDTMKLKRHAQRWGSGIGLLVAAMLTACGGGDGMTANTPATLSGRVTDASSGAAVADAKVIAMDRVTHRKYTATTDINGRYDMPLPQGHYDVASDDATEQDAAFVGLLSLKPGASVKQDFSLPDGDPGVISGTVLLPNGQAAAGYSLVLSYNQANADDVLETVTDARGQFSLKLGEQHLFDLDIFDPKGQFVEFIDMHKLDGHLHATIRLGETAQQNRYRHDQTPHPLVASSAGVAIAASDDGDFPFKQAILDGEYNVVFWGGRLTSKTTGMAGTWYSPKTSGAVDANTATSDANDDLPDDWFMRVDTTAAGKTADEVWQTVTSRVHVQDRGQPRLGVFVGDNGSWYYDHAVNINITDKGWNAFKAWDWHFEDETGDAYTLTIRASGWHNVSYDSEKPSIILMGRSKPDVTIPIPIPLP